MLAEFISYLNEQIGQPYLWGGQHTKLTPENYIFVITRKETNAEYRAQAIAFCKAKFDAGATVLYAYDCSGLGVYWLYNLKHLYKSDVNANNMMKRCELRAETPKRGWWIFRLDDAKKKATHIGYMVSDTELIEARGRKYGVVKRKFVAREWHVWGIPAVFKDEIEEKPEPAHDKKIKVIGGSVNVRNKDNTSGKILFTVHKGDIFPLIAVSGSGWYQIDTGRGESYISNRADLTKVI